MTPGEEDLLVAELLEAAEGPGGPELKGRDALDAYASLAASRRFDLEVVLRAVVRDELRTIAAMPPVRPNRYGSRPVPDTRTLDGDDTTSCRIIR